MSRGANTATANMRSKNIKTFLLFFSVAIIIGTAAFAFAGNIFNKIAETPILGGKPQVNLMDEMTPLVDPDSPYYAAFQDKNRINMLVLGINTGLSDTIMVASFDLDAKHIDLISIPRDTYYERKGYVGEAERKINAAYRKNPLNSAYAVSDVLLGMPIHCYAVVDYEGIVNIVDSMNGVPMNVPFRMKYSDPTDKPPLYIDIPAGEQVLDGEHAVQFLRYRKGYTEGDIGRVKAQQEFMKSAFKQMLGFDLPKIARVIAQNVDSDVTVRLATQLAGKAIGMTTDDLETYIMPYTAQDHAPWYVYPDEKGIKEMIEKIYSISPADPDVDGEAGNGGTSAGGE